MAETGEKYVQAANALGATQPKKSVPSRTDLVRDFLRTVLEQHASDTQRIELALNRAESEGLRLVDGGQVGPTSWEITDYRTGAVIARGDDGLEGYEKAGDRLDPEGTWIHVDPFAERELERGRVASTNPGLPPGLADVLEDWVLGGRQTSDEEVAEFLGYTPQDVAELRRTYGE